MKSMQNGLLTGNYSFKSMSGWHLLAELQVRPLKNYHRYPSTMGVQVQIHRAVSMEIDK